MTTLDEIYRQKVAEIIQAALVAEADEFLGRIAGFPARSATGYRDGYEEPRTIAFGSTPVRVRRPRIRASEVPFASELLPAYKRRFPELDKTMHELWIQGLSTRDFEPSLRALLGETTPLSPSTISRAGAAATVLGGRPATTAQDRFRTPSTPPGWSHRLTSPANTSAGANAASARGSRSSRTRNTFI